ncbi:MAG: hypothetical protein K8T20_04290 [Planctomycetes bacterium]|nr:hypothetical protein [Planctomycetota bacterium]
MSQAAGHRKPAPKPTLSSLAARVKTLEHEIETLRASLKRTEVAVAANELRDRNQRQATEGLARVQADVNELYRRGIVDANGKRISPDLPKEMNGSEADVV